MDDYQAPACPDCGTVLVDDPRGLVCRGCDVVGHPALEIERHVDDSPGIHGG